MLVWRGLLNIHLKVLELKGKLSQKLKISAKQLQSIKMLQCSNFELRQEILKTIEQNPFVSIDSYAQELEQNPVDLAPDVEYDHWNNANSQNSTDIIESLHSPCETLHDHLRWQLDIKQFIKREYAIALYLIDAIDNNGYLQQNVDELVKIINLRPKTNASEVLQVLIKLQKFEPKGVAARNLQECLLLQTGQNEKIAAGILKHKFNAFCNKEYEDIKAGLRINDRELQQALKTIETLNPKPGSKFDNPDSIYVIPDLIVKKNSGRWLVSLYDDLSQKIKLKPNKTELLSKVSEKIEKEFIQTFYNNAKWLKTCVESRNKTLLKVAKEIMEQQLNFMEKGEDFIQELKLEQIAKLCKLHISTVSRAANQKYIQTPHGTFELKHFFRKKIKYKSNVNASSLTIKKLIRELVDTEHLQSPLSDEKIAQTLAQKGMDISRRTVTKYRNSMNIATSHSRKITAHKHA